MASTDTKAPHGFNLLHSVTNILSVIGHAMMRPTDAKAENARRQIKALQALSDEELAERGVRREDIEFRVFSHTFYA